MTLSALSIELISICAGATDATVTEMVLVLAGPVPAPRSSLLFNGFSAAMRSARRAPRATFPVVEKNAVLGRMLAF